MVPLLMPLVILKCVRQEFHSSFSGLIDIFNEFTEFSKFYKNNDV